MIKNIFSVLKGNFKKGIHDSDKIPLGVTLGKDKKDVEEDAIFYQEDSDISVIGVNDAEGGYSIPSISDLSRYADNGEVFVGANGQKMMIGSVTGIKEPAVATSTSWGTWTVVGLGAAVGGGIALTSGGGGGESSTPAPVFTSSSTASISENTGGTVYDATADNDIGVSYTIGGTDGALFTIDPHSGAVSFNTAPDFENPLDTGSDNTYTFTVTAINAIAQSTSAIVELAIIDCLDWSDPLDAFDDAVWDKSAWANGGMFASDWDPNQISFDQGEMTITLDTVDGNLVSGEYRTDATYGYGFYEVSLQASDVPGTINGFFTYTGVSEGTQHDEIDFEIKGDDPTKVQLNYWTNDVEHPTVIDLGFDASAAFHTYAFAWREERIDWYIDGSLIHSEDGSRGALPSVPGNIFINLWASVGVEPWSSDYVDTSGPAYLLVDYVSNETYLCPSVI